MFSGVTMGDTSFPPCFPAYSGCLNYKLSRRKLSLTTCFYTNECLTSMGTLYYVISSSVSSYYSLITKFDEISCYLAGFYSQLRISYILGSKHPHLTVNLGKKQNNKKITEWFWAVPQTNSQKHELSRDFAQLLRFFFHFSILYCQIFNLQDEQQSLNMAFCDVTPRSFISIGCLIF